jgi:putative PIN family toxin of toxin-antitoxin system
MKILKVVLDTNVLVSALRSRSGASFRLLSLVDSAKFNFYLSVPLVLEYEEILLRELNQLTVTEQEIQDLIDFLCSVGQHQAVYFLWRPYLRDQDDDFVLELAVAAECDYIITFNQRDFAGIETFGVQTLKPREFLSLIGELL